MPGHSGQNIRTIGEWLAIHGDLYLPEDKWIKHLAIDTRTLAQPDETLFFALKDKRDGHDFIPAAYEAGVRYFVVSNQYISNHPDLNADVATRSTYAGAYFLAVRDTLMALQTVAGKHRIKFNLPVIGITGSNGKTLVKEWLFQLLQGDFQVRRSPKSFNSQIGVALSLWELQNKDTLGIFEAGISRANEMDSLRKMIQPTIGVLTNIGHAHQSGFSSPVQKLKEKLKLFRDVEVFIYSPAYVPESSEYKIPGKQQFTWAFETTSGPDRTAVLKPVDLTLQILSNFNGFTELRATRKGEVVIIKVPFQDQASLENLASCLSTLLVLNYALPDAVAKLKFLHPVSMRMALVKGIHDCSIIDDTYSADLDSLKIAIDFLKQQKQHPKHTLILSEILESGLPSEELYTLIARLIKHKEIDRFIGVGPEIKAHAELFPKNAVFFDSTEELLQNLDRLNFLRESILIKGARRFGLERITAQLSAKAHDTVLEINLRALNDNLQAYRQQLQPGVKMMAMVKAFSYGSGSYEVANLLSFQKVDYLTVAYADEGVQLRQAGIKLPIMVMSPEPSAFQFIWDNKLEPEIYSLPLLKAYLKFLDQTGITAEEKLLAPIHLKLDTGMHRLGFEQAHLPELLEILNANSQLLVKSIFTHLVGADEELHDDFTHLQLGRYQDMFEGIVQTLTYKPLRHVLNTAGISRFPEAQMDMVRLGIGLYGLDPNFKGPEEPQSVLVWKTTVSQIKQLEAGDTVGYGRKGVADEPTLIATVKVGYADGYSRQLGNGRGYMKIQGHQVSTIGSICMDMCMLDITPLQKAGIVVQPGEEVVIFNSPKAIQNLAAQLGTIPYEIVCNISQRVKRVYYYE
ncbi:MAG: bifunctional UDP-N-acetylmuramoyl-tripeptide:D-alanyl-D-alanine ligase/alanine racemase [Pedobacter sp.]|nr:MAG: bifunctional UDP-N-acetylmuramoyl-tripeptide:D-alanyl-D-alanine ligase/alanine racemase [Pedobacter sp.]